MADDIVTRLRIIHCAGDDLTPCGTCLICQAADEIERLRAAGDELAECLRYWESMRAELSPGRRVVVIGGVAYADRDALRTWEEARRD